MQFLLFLQISLSYLVCRLMKIIILTHQNVASVKMYQLFMHDENIVELILSNKGKG